MTSRMEALESGASVAPAPSDPQVRRARRLRTRFAARGSCPRSNRYAGASTGRGTSRRSRSTATKCSRQWPAPGVQCPWRGPTTSRATRSDSHVTRSRLSSKVRVIVLWLRSCDGGAVLITHIGEHEARIEYIGCELFENFLFS
jgi:hypothetical protein